MTVRPVRRTVLLLAMVAATLSAAPPATRPATAPAVPVSVYAIDFNAVDLVGPHWSTDVMDDTPGEPSKQYFGPFDEAPVKLSLDHLPPHAAVRVRFDLITWERWNGDNAYFGRDLWDFRVVGGQPLIHTTFSNCGFFSNNSDQSYPDQYPWYPTHPAWTGAAAHQTLGWKISAGPQRWGCDSTYAVDVTFPHTADELALRFATLIKKHENKRYGFLNFCVEALPAVATATAEQLAGWWSDLAGEDAVKANAAVWSLAATGDAATAYAATHLPANASPAPVNVDLEARWTAGSFQYDSADSRQLARGIHVLEVVGTPAAQAVLKRIGYDGTPSGAPPDQYTDR